MTGHIEPESLWSLYLHRETSRSNFYVTARYGYHDGSKRSISSPRPVWRGDPSVDQMPSQAQQRKTLTALLIVDHLPRHFFDEELAALVRPFGTVVSAHVMRDGAGDHLDFGYVELDTLENAQCAICVLNGQEVYGHTITVGLVTPPYRAA